MVHLFRSLHPQDLSLRLKYFLLHRRGDGVHSPYVYSLIHRTLSNRYPYYCFNSLRQKTDKMTRERYQLIFRLLHHFGEIESLLLLAPQDSLLPSYIEQTGKVRDMQIWDTHTNAFGDTGSMNIPQVLVLESWDENDWDRYTAIAKQMCQNYSRSAILVSTAGFQKRQQFKRLYSSLQPQVVVDIIDVQLLVFDTNLTAGYYKAYH